MMDWILALIQDLWGHRGYRILVMAATVEVVAIASMIGLLLLQTKRRFARDAERRRLVDELRRHNIADATDEWLVETIHQLAIPHTVALREALLELGLNEHRNAAEKAWRELGFATREHKILRKKSLRKRLKSIRRIYVFAAPEDRDPILAALEGETDHRFRVTAAQALARIDNGADVVTALRDVTLDRRIMEQPFYSIFRTLSSDQLEKILSEELSVLQPRIRRVLLEVAAMRSIGSMQSELREMLDDEQLEERVGAAKIAAAMNDDTGHRALRKLIHDPDWQVRAQALRGLATVGDTDDLPTLQVALTDPEFWVRDNAAFALGALHSRGHRLPAATSPTPTNSAANDTSQPSSQATIAVGRREK